MSLFDGSTATYLALAISVGIPLLSSLLAKQHWDGSVTGFLTLALACVNGFLTEWANADAGYDWKHGLGVALMSFVIALASRYGIYKDTKLDAAALALGSGKPPAA